ncbi:MAG TPA: hypothetical protein VHW65_02015 [Gemmatimonadales bacterium]|jgi:hypothetical protein|nr:hypothetical protein [Gemmatimonadales bacterium]
MNEHLKERVLRRLDALSDERGYQVLDYVEFLESKYAERSAPTNLFAKLTDRVEDTLRAGKMPLNAISGTVTFFDGASKVMKGLASAAQAVVDEASKTAQNLTTSKSEPGDTSKPG